MNKQLKNYTAPSVNTITISIKGGICSGGMPAATTEEWEEMDLS